MQPPSQRKPGSPQRHFLWRAWEERVIWRCDWNHTNFKCSSSKFMDMYGHHCSDSDSYYVFVLCGSPSLPGGGVVSLAPFSCGCVSGPAGDWRIGLWRWCRGTFIFFSWLPTQPWLVLLNPFRSVFAILLECFLLSTFWLMFQSSPDYCREETPFCFSKLFSPVFV